MARQALLRVVFGLFAATLLLASTGCRQTGAKSPANQELGPAATPTPLYEEPLQEDLIPPVPSAAQRGPAPFGPSGLSPAVGSEAVQLGGFTRPRIALSSDARVSPEELDLPRLPADLTAPSAAGRSLPPLPEVVVDPLDSEESAAVVELDVLEFTSELFGHDHEVAARAAAPAPLPLIAPDRTSGPLANVWPPQGVEPSVIITPGPSSVPAALQAPVQTAAPARVRWIAVDDWGRPLTVLSPEPPQWAGHPQVWAGAETRIE